MDNDNRHVEGGELHYPCGECPGHGELREVAPGVHWVSMPLSFELSGINLWLLDDGPGYTLVDTGISSDDARHTWNRLIERRLGDRPITRMLATHMHADHMGLAGWLGRRFGCRLWMTQLEYLYGRMLASDTGRAAPDEAIDFYRRAGWDEQALDTYRSRFGNFGRMVEQMPDSYRRIRDGERLRIGDQDWEVVVGSGHSPEHACFYNARQKLLISGDQVLPRISSNLGVYPTEPDADPLSQWLDSLAMLRSRIPADVLVLPAHGEPFFGLHARLAQLERSLQRALERLRQGLSTPKRVIDVFEMLFSRPIPLTNASLLSLATGESVAHLNHLLHLGEAVVRTDADGVDWYGLCH